MIHLSWLARVLLELTALGAGFVDAIAGGGGTLTVPALLAAGLPPPLALGTNKGQAIFGTATAFTRYAHSPLLDRKLARLTFPLGFLGALFGTRLLLSIRPDVLRPVVIGLLIFAAAFLAIRRSGAATRGALVTRPLLAAGAVSLVLGTYDGFFGPGTGAFLIAAFVALLGRRLDAASADAKAVNLASNLAALATFALAGDVLWSVALPMAVAQALGGYLGAHATLRGGERLVRGAVLVVVAALLAKLVVDLVRSHAG